MVFTFLKNQKRLKSRPEPGLVFRMNEVHIVDSWIQGYLAHTKTPIPLRPPCDPRHRPTADSKGGAFPYERGTPVGSSGITTTVVFVPRPDCGTTLEGYLT